MRIARLAALSAVVIAGCSKPVPAKLATAQPPPPAPTAPPSEPEPEPSNVPSDLPPFGATAEADPAKALGLLDEAAMQVMPGDEVAPGSEAWNMTVLAVKTDPGSGRARVALAQLVNDDAFTAAQLEPLTTATDCVDCADALLNIDVETWAAAAPLVAKVTASPQRHAVDVMRAFPDSGDKTTIAPFFKGKKVALTTECLTCELAGEGSPGRTKKSSGAKVLALIVARQKEENFYAMSAWYCAKDCCASTEAFDGTPNGHTFLAAVCFAPGTDTVTTLKLVE